MSALPPKADIAPRRMRVRFMTSEAKLRSGMYLHNSRLCWHSLDLAHVPMVYGGHMAIVPGDCDCIPTHLGDNAAVSSITSPTNAAALLEAFRVGGGHRPLLIVPICAEPASRPEIATTTAPAHRTDAKCMPVRRKCPLWAVSGHTLLYHRKRTLLCCPLHGGGRYQPPSRSESNWLSAAKPVGPLDQSPEPLCLYERAIMKSGRNKQEMVIPLCLLLQRSVLLVQTTTK